MRIDLVTVYHNDKNHLQHLDLRDQIARHEANGGYRFIAVDNRNVNRGFARGCNLGACHPTATAPVIGFLNPDVQVSGPFIDDAAAALTGTVVITGCRFGKPASELAQWGVRNWVCGAAMFVQRRWFTAVGGFDEQFTWSHEETDLIRQAEGQGLTCQPIKLPIDHASPADNTPEDSHYKQHHFAEAQRRYYRKWGRPHAV